MAACGSVNIAHPKIWNPVFDARQRARYGDE
jgi:hypothetical protein